MAILPNDDLQTEKQPCWNFPLVLSAWRTKWETCSFNSALLHPHLRLLGKTLVVLFIPGGLGSLAFVYVLQRAKRHLVQRGHGLR